MGQRTSNGESKMKKGFTLIEVIIAILVLSISTLAVIAMQTSTLRGYSSIRDTDDAVMIAHRTADLLHVNASSWRVSDTNAWSFNVTSSYAGETPFDVLNPLALMFAVPWDWIPLFNAPVDGRMASTASSLGRHCVYVRGGPFEGSLTTTTDTVTGDINSSPAMLVQIAVVSTGIRNTITDCSAPTNNSPQFDISELGFSGGDEIPLGQSLELKGYRPTYHATMVFKRDFL